MRPVVFASLLIMPFAGCAAEDRFVAEICFPGSGQACVSTGPVHAPLAEDDRAHSSALAVSLCSDAAPSEVSVVTGDGQAAPHTSMLELSWNRCLVPDVGRLVEWSRDLESGTYEVVVDPGAQPLELLIEVGAGGTKMAEHERTVHDRAVVLILHIERLD